MRMRKRVKAEDMHVRLLKVDKMRLEKLAALAEISGSALMRRLIREEYDRQGLSPFVVKS